MRFYTQQHPHYCGIDLHARTMYLCILNQAGAIVLHRNMNAAWVSPVHNWTTRDELFGSAIFCGFDHDSHPEPRIPESAGRDWTFTAAPPKQLELLVRALPLTRA